MTELSDDHDAMIIYEDECHFQIVTSVTQKWVKKGSKPKVKSFAGRANVSYGGFVVRNTGEFFNLELEIFNYETIITLLKYLYSKFKNETKKIYIVLDNASWHKKAIKIITDESNKEYKKLREKFRFIFLPPYSPDLNPIEQCWRITRRDVTHNRFFANTGEIREHLENYWDQLQVPRACGHEIHFPNF